ncbi:MAG: hypothetical protein RBT61_00895 [Candidatus Kapabacteria bacterium]|jgi:hypothetical protein|nr:hypothetical protein [Candidatus Kapabacteria bacterium]
MKKIVFGLMLFLGVFAFGQKQVNYKGFDLATNNSEITFLQGNWSINTLITDNKTREYILYPQVSNEYGISYGNGISINSNGTFYCSYRAKCGNDLFTETIGKYKIIDENYVCFSLEENRLNGFLDTKPNEDLGLFRIYREKDKITLRRSNGNSEQDSKNIQYLEMLTSKYSEVRGCEYLKWKITKLPNDVKEVVDFCMAQNQIKKYELLYDNAGLILVKVQNDFRYIIYQGYDRNNIKVALYEEDFFTKINDIVYKIENNKSLKETIIQDENDYYDRRNLLSRNTITVFRHKNKIQKIIYNAYWINNRHIEYTYWLEENEPVACSIKAENIDDFYYIFNWEHNYGAIPKERTTNHHFMQIKNLYNGFIEVVKKHKLK